MAAYRLVYDSRYLQADCQEPGAQLRNHTLGNRVWASYLCLFLLCSGCFAVQMTSVLQIVAAATVLATTERPSSKHLLQASRDIDHRHAVLSKLTYPRSCSGPTFTPPLSELIRLCKHRVAVT